MQLKKSIVWLLSFLSRWVWRLLVLTIICIAVMVSIGRQAAPLLHAHKAWLETNLTASFGEVVAMQEVNAYWEGLVPELVVKKLSIGSAVQIDSALMRVDILGSVKARALVFDTLDVSQAVVRIPVGLSAVDQMFNIRAYLELLFSSTDIRVRNLEMMLVQDAEHQLPLYMDELIVKNDGSTHWLNSAITVGKKNDTQNDNAERKKPLRLRMKFDGDASNIFSGKGSAYLDFGDTKNIPAVQQFLLGLSHNQLFPYLKEIQSAEGEIWAAWENQSIEWVLESSIKNMVFSTNGAVDSKVNRSGRYAVDFSGKLTGNIMMQDMQVKQYFLHSMPDQNVLINQHNYSLPVFGLQYPDNDSTISDALFGVSADDQRHFLFNLPELQLATAVQYLDLLPSRQLRDILKKLKPTGVLKNVLISVPLQKERELSIRANLDKVSVSAWEGVPALASVDGYIEASADSGFVEVDSQQGFSMHYATLYHQPMKYDRALGRVHWNIEPATKHIYVGSYDLDFHGEEGEFRGSFWLDVPPAHSSQAAELYLAASLTDTHVRFRDKYLPYTLNSSLKDWLASSIKDGNMRDSGFIYRGTLRKNEAQEQALMFFSNVKSARLKFDAAWPELINMDAQVLVDNDVVHARIKKAGFLGFNLSNAMADVKPSVNQQAHFLILQADASGPGSDILRVMRETPLQKTFGNIFDGWELKDQVTGHLKLGVKIGTAEEQDFQEIDLHLNDNDLLVGNVNLPLQQMKGDIHYSSTAGLSSTPLSARLWEQNQLINIVPVIDGDGLPDMFVSMTGNIDPQAAALWAHLPFVHFLQGVFPVEGMLTIPIDAVFDAEKPTGTMLMRSDMKGVSIDLPPPFDKSADALLPTTVGVDLWKDKQQYRVEYGTLVSALIEQKVTGALKGDIAINQQDVVGNNALARLPDYLRVRGTLDQALLSDWLPVIERNTAFTKTDEEKYPKNNHGTKEHVETTAFPIFDLLIKQLTIGSLKLDDMRLDINYQKDSPNGNYWKVAFQNAMMTGRYHAFDDIKQLPEVEFDTVKVGEADQKAEQNQQQAIEDDSKRVDPLADVIPQDLPAMRVHAKQVILKGDDVGDWRYVIKPNKKGVELNDLYVAMPGLTMKGIEKDQGATVHWNRDGHEMSTEISSRFSLSNQDGVENLFGIEQIIEADKTDIQGLVKWKGSPAMLSFRRLQGDLSFTSEKGRFLNSTASTDLMRVINVFNFSTWARRLKLDFTDLYKKGVSFDKVSAQLSLDQGKVIFDKPLVMDGPSGRFELKGVIDSVQNTIDASLIVTIPVNKNATWIAALAAGLPVAAGVWAVSKIFGDQIDKLSSVSYSVSGALDEPDVKFIGLLPSLTKEDRAKKPTEEKKSETPQKNSAD